MRTRLIRTVKATLGPLVRRSPRLLELASRTLYAIDRSFHTLSPGAPDAITKALTRVRDAGVVGDYYEFGVFRGRTLHVAEGASRVLGMTQMHCYGFDSFEGLPDVEGIDTDGNRFFRGQFACSLEDVRQNLRGHDAEMARITLIPGFYADSLTDELHDRHPFRRASVVMLDCDLYSSTATVLSWLDRYLAPGTVLLLDDWDSYGDDPELGQPRALAEWLERRSDLRAEHLQDYEPHGRMLLLRER